MTWQGARPFVVAARAPACRDVASVWLAPEDGAPLPAFAPGQFVTVALTPGGRRACYSLSAAPDPARWRLTVKDQAPGDDPPRRTSSLLARGLPVGARVLVDAPAGRFVLPPGDDPVVLVAGGVGVTPFAAMLEAAVRARDPRPVVVVLGMRRRDEHPLREEVATAVAALPRGRLHVAYSQPAPGDACDRVGRLSAEVLAEVVPPADRPYTFLLCGPPPLLAALTAGLEALGVPRSAVRVEVFGGATVRALRRLEGQDAPSPAAPAGGGPAGAAVVVRFARSGREVPWTPAAETLLGLAEGHGVPIPSACLAGRCGTCLTRLIGGRVQHVVEPTFGGLRPGVCLPCVAVPDPACGPVTLDA